MSHVKSRSIRRRSNTDRDREFLKPDVVARLGNLEMVARFIVEGFLIGLHRSPYHGFSAEFSSYRKYVPGDDIRFIDWKLNARTDRYYIKQFEENTNTRVSIVLDCSGSMNEGAEFGGITKFMYARMLAASLAFLVLRQNDAVGITLFDNEIVDGVPPNARSTQLSALLGLLTTAKAANRTSFTDGLIGLPEQIGHRGVVMVISDLLADPDTVTDRIRSFRVHGHEVIVFHVLSDVEREFPVNDMTEFIDAETGERLSAMGSYIRDDYLKALSDHCNTLRFRCRDMDVDFVELTTTRPVSDALNAYLTRRRRLGG